MHARHMTSQLAVQLPNIDFRAEDNLFSNEGYEMLFYLHHLNT